MLCLTLSLALKAPSPVRQTDIHIEEDSHILLHITNTQSQEHTHTHLRARLLVTARSLKLNSFRHSRVSGTYSTHDRILDLVLAAGNRNSRRHSKSLASPRSIRTSFSFSQGALNSLVNDGKSFLLTRMINSHFTPSLGRLLISTRLSITLKKQTLIHNTYQTTQTATPISCWYRGHGRHVDPREDMTRIKRLKQLHTLKLLLPLLLLMIMFYFSVFGLLCLLSLFFSLSRFSFKLVSFHDAVFAQWKDARAKRSFDKTHKLTPAVFGGHSASTNDQRPHRYFHFLFPLR